ncbi:Acetylornithine deacetylase [hydrothermal vent metagenome]|uniref:Acetylornithine deacetylase n=1 Tax=hydrothermal vent metagenome TaxID=652676 RepID=A0A3B0V6M8_9ZZZZ
MIEANNNETNLRDWGQNILMIPIETVVQNGRIQAALAHFPDIVPEIVEQAIAIQQIPAPTFAEAERAAYIESRFVEVGLVDVVQDELHTVYGRFPGHQPNGRSPVIISAHSDTVFPADTDLTVRREGHLTHGPGIGDNSTGVAGLIALAESLRLHEIRPLSDIWFVSNVREEGLGDLLGMRAVVERFGAEATYLVVEGGLYGQISHQAIGVERYEIVIRTAGGHSWGNFGRRSAIHELGRLITAVDSLKVPTHPKTTYNVGVIEGGTSINTVAQSAKMLLDLRSEEPRQLAILVAEVEKLIAKMARQSDISVEMSQIGSRPAGHIQRDAPLVQQAMLALRHVGCQQISTIASSTDANVPLSRGFTAVCIGLTESGNVHRLDEYMDSTYLPAGMSQLLLLTLAVAGI